MKTFTRLSIVILLLNFTPVFAQINLNKVLNNVKKKTEKKVEQRVEKKLDNAVDKTLDKVENTAEDAVKPKKKEGDNPANGKETNETTTASSPTSAPTLEWSKYDFVPGTEIIFEDNLEGEQNGEFPSKWDLVQGTFENANFDGVNVIYHMKCNMNGGGGVVPMLKNCKEDYLPEEFTIEFDAYFNESPGSYYTIYFADYKNQLKLDKSYQIGNKWIRIYKNSADGNGIENHYYPGYSDGRYDKSTKWRHVAISFNKRALKVYMDDARVLNIPNLGYNPTGFTIGKQNVGGNDPGYTRNFRIAKGAVPLYDKLLTDGKFVTTGIKFDVNKATIKPESMGTINYVVKMMQDHPELKFSVEGHTDSDGETASNQKLSEERAKSVMSALINAGIDAGRLRSKGWGESKPMTGNDSTEGKAQNRRVEFVKL